MTAERYPLRPRKFPQGNVVNLGDRQMSTPKGKARPSLPRQEARWPPPAFQIYPSDLMASEVYMLSSLGERGLLLSMMAYTWVNVTIPSDKGQIARLLGINVDDIERYFGDLIRVHFVPAPGDESRLFERDLERQKQIMSVRRANLSAGGTKGGRSRQARVRKAFSSLSQASGQVSSQASSLAKASEEKGKEVKESFQDGAVIDASTQQWIRDYDGGP